LDQVYKTKEGARIFLSAFLLSNHMEAEMSEPCGYYLNLGKVRQTWTDFQVGKNRVQNDANLLLCAVIAGFLSNGLNICEG